VFGIVLGAFFVSGACGLIHEVAWTRLLRLIMGNGTFSTTTVLCVFMGGLALGSYLSGRFIDRRHDLLRIFALFEGIIGVYCFLLPWLINGAEPLYRVIYQNTHTSFYLFSLIRFVFSGLILFIPAIFMGATLPVLTRFLTRSPARMGRSVGTLYAVNTFGAVLGASVSGFFLIPALGVTKTIYLASVFNLLVAVTAFWLYRRTPNEEDKSPLVEPSPDSGAQRKARTKDRKTAVAPLVPLDYGKGALGTLLWGYAFAGFAALVYEIAWFRALSLLIGSTVYAFSLMLTAFVLGIAVGSMIYSRFADRVRDPMCTLAIIQVGIGLSALLVVPFIGVMPFFVTGLIARYIDSFWALQLAEFALCMGVMLIPTTLMGAAFPLVNRLYNQQSAAVGRTVGTVYGANTVGNISGAFIGGFILIPFLGIQKTLLIAVAANILVGCIFLMFTHRLRPLARSVVVAAIVLATGTGIAAVPPWDPAKISFGPYHTALRLPLETSLSRSALESMEARNKVLFHKEGLTTTVTVKEIAEGVRALYINGKPDASSRADLPHQELVAHVPMMFHPQPRNALVIGLASGISLGSVSRYPLDRIDCVEISPAMLEACRYFDAYNYSVMDDPRVQVFVADGRNHLLLTDRTYDVIISQPSNPYLAGVADLFTREYFELCRMRLNEGGVMCTWMQAYKMDLDTFRSIVKTFHVVFPDMSFWRSGKSDCLLIGTKGPQTMNYRLLKERLASEAIGADLKRIDIDSVPEFLVQLVMGARGVENFSATATIHTDDNALVEFSAPRALTRTVLQLPLVEAIEKNREVDLDFLTVSDGDTVLSEELDAVKKTAEQFITARGHVFQAYSLYNRNQAVDAFVELQKAAALNPSDAMLKEFNAVDHQRAFNLAREGKIDEAAALYQEMIRRVPGDERAHYNLALALKLQGNLEAALGHYREAVRLKPDYIIAVYNVGEISEQMGDLDTAFSSYRRALALNPDLIPALNSLARLLAMHPDTNRRNPQESVRLAEKACRLTGSRDPYMLETLSVAYETAGRSEDACITARQALALSRNAGNTRLIQRLNDRREHLQCH